MCANSIISWNIACGNGLIGNKADDPDFVNIIKDHSIICLQETGFDICIPGYTSYSDLRNIGRGGGVTTLVKSSLASVCSRVKIKLDDHDNRSMNIVVIRYKSYLKQEQDTFIINTYIPPANSKRKCNSTDSVTNFEILHSIIRDYNDKGSIIVVGDLNARIGNCQDLASNDNSGDFIDLPSCLNSEVGIPFGCPVSTLRNSQDIGSNSHKPLLLDIINNNSLLILNGRTIGDSSGRYTCYKWNGNSVVDYFICNNNVLHYVNFLSVKAHTLYSDHNPLVLTLKKYPATHNRGSNRSFKFEKAPPRYKINADSINTFTEAQNHPDFVNQLDSLLTEAPSCTTKEQITKLNDSFMNLIDNAASKSFDKSKPVSPSEMKPKHNAWFDKSCRTAKRHMARSARLLDKFPDAQSIKYRHSANNKSYRKLVKSKKDRFYSTLNRKIKTGKVISWRDFNKLKNYTQAQSESNTEDSNLNSFRDFYENLYSDDHRSIDNLTKVALMEDAINIASSSNPNDTLNAPFNREEMDACIRRLKTGKASSFDMVSNEIIKAFTSNTRDVLVNLFNVCLKTGSYLWNDNVVTPIHKKGSRTDPDNYRAISVCSCIGKLLSTMLLDRLISHRSANSPDPPNQCGFTKGNQCADHILTLLTILEKYKRLKKKVYVVFVDLCKAFDMVCRQALLFKLACYGVNGGFFHLLRDMYNNSKGYIKLNGKVSPMFKIMKGTEQGHPLSPELFKVYFKGLSDLLNSITTNNPALANKSISHLAWADDLVLLALDRISLEKQISILEDYCNDWGLEINDSKTKYMIFNGRKRSIQNPAPPTINGAELEQVTNYCYLGIKISSNGKFSDAIKSLASKGLGALMSLRKSVDRRFIHPKSLDQLFDSLVAPILTYGCQIWLPVSSIINCLTRNNTDHDKLLAEIAKQPYEKVLLRHIKYLLGINRRASNAAAWGETGRFPLLIKSIKLCVNYFIRTINLDDSHLVKAAMEEQISLNLPWFSGIKSIIDTFDSINPIDYNCSPSESTNALMMSTLCSSTDIVNSLQEQFKQVWSASVAQSPKLSFYNTIKGNDFTWELYLDSTTKFKHRRTMAQIRSSSHKLNIETGRYEGIARQDRICTFCRDNGTDPPVIEDEKHLINVCPAGAETRANFRTALLDICSTNSVNISCDINLAKPYPATLDVDQNKSIVHAKIIRLACNSLYKLYSNALRYKNTQSLALS